MKLNFQRLAFEFFCLILRVLKPLITIRFGIYRSMRIGSMVGDLDCLLSQFSETRKGGRKNLNIFFSEVDSSKDANIFITELWNRRGVKIFRYRPNYFHFYGGLVNRARINTAFEEHLVGTYLRKDLILDDRDPGGATLGLPPPFDLSPKETEIGEKWLSSLGISSNSKIVLLLGRDSLYGSTRKDSSHLHTIRNMDINHFSQAALELADRDFYVFRMGSLVKSRFDVADETKIFDYATNGMRSEFLDVFLAKRCSLAVSVSSGYDALPIAFRKPIVFVNYPCVGTGPFHLRNAIICCKTMIDATDKHKLSMSEMYHRQIFFNFYTTKFQSAGCEFIDNSEKEIKLATIEGINHLVMSQPFSKKWITCQHMFRHEFMKFCYLSETSWHGEIRAHYSASALEAGHFGLL